MIPDEHSGEVQQDPMVGENKEGQDESLLQQLVQSEDKQSQSEV